MRNQFCNYPLKSTDISKKLEEIWCDDENVSQLMSGQKSKKVSDAKDNDVDR